MTDLEAMSIRQSRRTYCNTPIESDSIEKLLHLIDDYNEKSGLHIQFLQNHNEVFRNFRYSFGFYSGVQNYFAMIGSCTDLFLNEKIGYYGEQLVLEATKLGLGTCWVGGCFDSKACAYRLATGERLVCVIAVGNCSPEKSSYEKMIYKMMKHSHRRISQLYSADSEIPDWFESGLKAVTSAPSAFNHQPASFLWENQKAIASIPDYSSKQSIDLGIAKFHFEVGAGNGVWKPGNSAPFEVFCHHG